MVRLTIRGGGQPDRKTISFFYDSPVSLLLNTKNFFFFFTCIQCFFRTSCSTSYNKRMLARLTKDFLPTHLYPLVPCLFISGQVINSTTVI